MKTPKEKLGQIHIKICITQNKDIEDTHHFSLRTELAHDQGNQIRQFETSSNNGWILISIDESVNVIVVVLIVQDGKLKFLIQFDPKQT